MPQDQVENLGNDDEEHKRKVASKHEWFTKAKQPKDLTDSDWNVGKNPQQGPTQSWNCQVVPVGYFFNNDLKYLQGGILTMTYTTSITKTKATQYDLPGIKDMIQNIWSPIKVAYDKQALWDELYKFSDGTLTTLQSLVDDITKNILVEYLPQRRWSLLEKKRGLIIVKAIDKKLKERRMMRSFKKFIARDLWKVCNDYGFVVDAFIPYKKSKAGNVNLLLLLYLLILMRGIHQVLMSQSGKTNNVMSDQVLPSLILNDSCISDRDFSLSLIGGLWVRIETVSISANEKLLNHIGLGVMVLLSETSSLKKIHCKGLTSGSRAFRELEIRRTKKMTGDDNHEDTNGMIKVLPPKTAKEVVARERERKARTTLLMALPEDHFAKFHKMADTKEIAPQLDYADLEQINDDDIEEMDLKWQVAIISMRIKKFYKRTGNQDGRRRDNGNKTRGNGRRPAYQDDSKAMVTIDGEDIDWSRYVEEDTQNYVMMAYSSSNSGSAMRENVKETGTPNHSPKIEKQDRNGHTRKGLGYAFTRKACFVCEPISVENQANKSAGPKEANNSAGIQDKDDQGANSEEIDLHEEHFVMPIWSAYLTTVKSSRDKIEKNNDFNTCEKPVSQVEQIFLEELEKLKRHEKEANDASESPRKGATHDIQNASTTSTNLINTASTPLSTAGPSRAFNDGVVTNFNNLETTITVSQTPTTRIHTIQPQTQILRDPMLAVQTRSKVNKNSEAHALHWKMKVGLMLSKRNCCSSKFKRQEERIEYDEVFAPVARIEAIRIFLAFASYMGFIVYQIDVKSAFLYGIIDEEVYVSQPHGFVDSKFPNKDKKDIMLVQVYVDDIIFSFTKKSWCDEFEALMKNSVNTASTPIETHKPLVKNEEAADVDVHLYRDAYEKKLIHVLKIHTDDNVADLLTKAFDVSRLKFLFWNTATFKIVNNFSQIHAKVAGKPVVITEVSIRGDLLFDDVDRIDCLTNEAIFKNVALMGYEGDLTKLTFQKSLFSPQWKYLIHTIIYCLSSKTVVEVEDSGTSIESQPTPSPTQPSARDEPYLIESSSDRISSQDPRARIKNLEKRCKPSISRHRAWLRSVSLLSKKNKLSKRKSVSKQGRKNAKTGPTKDDSDKLDAELDEDMEYMDTEEALNKGSQSTVGTARQDDDTARPDVSTARQDLSTARLDDNTARQGLSTASPTTTPTTSTIFDDEEMTLADTLIKLKDDKAKGVAFKDSKSTDKPVRSILTLKPLLKIDPKDKGKEYFERRKKQLAEERAVAIRNKPPTKNQLRRLMMTYLKNIGSDKGVESTKKRKEGSRMKRMSKRQKNDVDLEEEEKLKTFLKIDPDEEGVIDYEVLDKRFLIINWESKFYHYDRHRVEGIYYRIFRSDGSSRWIKTCSEMVTRMTTGKETSNPFMASSLLKTT
nr:hypothetical protein [Tanacetum cinerariifolium]